MLSSHDGTVVKVAGPGIPAAEYPLDAGAFLTMVEVGSFIVSANFPILVTQGIDCEPSLSLATAVGATTLLTNLPFAVPPGFDLQLEVVRPTGAPILLDGTGRRRGHVPVGGARVRGRVGPARPCIPTDGSGVCTHLLVSTSKNGGFGMSLRGMDVGSSFAFTTPLVGCDPCLNYGWVPPRGRHVVGPWFAALPVALRRRLPQALLRASRSVRRLSLVKLSRLRRTSK